MKKSSSLENALKILSLFTVEKPQFSVSEIAKQLDIANSTAHRLLMSLMCEEFVIKDPYTHQYRLSVAIRSLENIIMKNNQMYEVSKKVASEYAKKYNQSISVTTLRKSCTYYLYSAWSTIDAEMFMVYPGKEDKQNSTSSSRLLLAYDIHQTTLPQPFAKAIRQRQYDVRHGILDIGYSTIAVPIRKNRKVVAALELLIPTERLTKHKEIQIVSQIQDYAAKISSKLQ